MKLTRSRLNQIVKEELEHQLHEAGDAMPGGLSRIADDAETVIAAMTRTARAARNGDIEVVKAGILQAKRFLSIVERNVASLGE